MGFRFDTKKEKTKPKDFALCVAESGQRCNSPAAIADGAPRTVHSSTVVAHSAEADFRCYVLRPPAPKEMCHNDLLNQIARHTCYNQLLAVPSSGQRATTVAKSNLAR